MNLTLIVVYTWSLTSSVCFCSSCWSFSEPLLDFCLKSVGSFRELTEGLFSSIVISSLPSSVSSVLLNICDLNKGTHNGPQNSLSLCYHAQFIRACEKNIWPNNLSAKYNNWNFYFLLLTKAGRTNTTRCKW